MPRRACPVAFLGQLRGHHARRISETSRFASKARTFGALLAQPGRAPGIVARHELATSSLLSLSESTRRRMPVRHSPMTYSAVRKWSRDGRHMIFDQRNARRDPGAHHTYASQTSAAAFRYSSRSKSVSKPILHRPQSRNTSSCTASDLSNTTRRSSWGSPSIGAWSPHRLHRVIALIRPSTPLIRRSENS